MTKVIAIDGLQNCGKSTIINGSKDGSILPISDRYPGKNFKFYGETARDVINEFDGIQKRDMQSFQDIIHYREAERLHKIRLDISKGIYDVVFVDRTSLGNWVYAIYNHQLGIIKNTHEPIFDPKIYDIVIYMNNPIGKYGDGNKEFSHYESEDFKNMFDKCIGECFPNSKTFENYIENQGEINSLLDDIIYPQ